jgi:hypothetical protein
VSAPLRPCSLLSTTAASLMPHVSPVRILPLLPSHPLHSFDGVHHQIMQRWSEYRCASKARHADHACRARRARRARRHVRVCLRADWKIKEVRRGTTKRRCKRRCRRVEMCKQRKARRARRACRARRQVRVCLRADYWERT